jgi:hypothetical protein
MVCYKVSLEERLKAHPRLRERIEEILHIVEAKAGELDQADVAEQRTIEELRRLGQEVLHEWGRSKEEQKVQALGWRPRPVKYQGKKS